MPDNAEPTTRELKIMIDSLGALLNERDRRYDDRFKAQEVALQTALTGQKELTTAAFASSEKAIVKAEEAQKSYNQTHNDVNRKMDDQYKAMMPRPEADSRFGTHDLRLQEMKDDISLMRVDLMKEISELRESRSEGKGDKTGRSSQQQLLMAILSVVISLLVVGSAVVGIAYAIRK